MARKVGYDPRTSGTDLLRTSGTLQNGMYAMEEDRTDDLGSYLSSDHTVADHRVINFFLVMLLKVLYQE